MINNDGPVSSASASFTEASDAGDEDWTPEVADLGSFDSIGASPPFRWVVATGVWVSLPTPGFVPVVDAAFSCETWSELLEGAFAFNSVGGGVCCCCCDS